jgi:hypothetical protein
MADVSMARRLPVVDQVVRVVVVVALEQPMDQVVRQLQVKDMLVALDLETSRFLRVVEAVALVK